MIPHSGLPLRIFVSRGEEKVGEGGGSEIDLPRQRRASINATVALRGGGCEDLVFLAGGGGSEDGSLLLGHSMMTMTRIDLLLTARRRRGGEGGGGRLSTKE